MSGIRTCGSCGHPNTGDAMFCSKCGHKLPLHADAPAATPPEPAPPAPEERAVEPVAEAPAPTPQSAPRVAGAARTMLGMPMPDAEAVARAKAEAERRRADRAAATIVDPVPAPEAAEAPAAEEPIAEEPAPEASASEAPATEPDPEPAGEASAPAKRIAGSARTMLGMPAPQAAAVQEAVAAAKQKKAEAEATRAQAAKQEAAPKVEAAPPARSPAAALDPTTNRTMLGQPAPKRDEVENPPAAAGSPDTPLRSRAPVMYPSSSGEDDAYTLPPATRSGGRGLALGVLAIGVIVLVIGGGALAWTLLMGGSDLRAGVVRGDAGEMLEIEVPGAQAGTSVRFRGAERELEAGAARFPLSAADLSLGDNELTVDVVSPEGDVESHTVDLHLEMRIRADLGPLQSAPAAIDVIVEAPPGSEVSLDGEALELDAQGRATRRFPIDGSDASAEGVVEHVVRYRVQPPEGETEQGALHTRIPLTTMQIDRPGTQVVTDRSSVEIAGAVAPGSTVTVDGGEVEVRMGRFLHTYPLPEPAAHEVEVVARAPGKAPRVARLAIRRVADLEAEAARFEVNESLTYARIAQNPATYRGQRVELRGMVYNVDVRAGQSVLQILVEQCPGGERCPVWVTYPAATDAELRSRVRVLGTVAGEQQFRTQNDQIRTVPRVDATFVLPAR